MTDSKGSITKTCLYNFDPLKPHFYIVKLGFTGLYEAVLTSTHNLCFEHKYEKYQSFLSENFQFLEVKFSIYLNRRVFVMIIKNYKSSYTHASAGVPLCPVLFLIYINDIADSFLSLSRLFADDSSLFYSAMTKTRLCKYIENFTS